MGKTDQNKILKGTDGYVWLNGELLAYIESIELKISGNFEEKSFCGDYSTHYVYTGWSGEGTMTVSKVDSKILSMLGDSYKTGVMPEIKIITKLENVNNGKSERTAVTGVVLSEFALAKFESKGVISDEIPIKFDDYEVLETI